MKSDTRFSGDPERGVTTRVSTVRGENDAILESVDSGRRFCGQDGEGEPAPPFLSIQLIIGKRHKKPTP